ncbi:unnamed protein product [Blumeria hordei]|uniref:Uncharacterized protein n=1 Tax=Blumeria hordei TaxID=2867405 RepID=A0A383V2F4_BLUHO|nr:unnamed protein product [Blumeria hordei]
MMSNILRGLSGRSSLRLVKRRAGCLSDFKHSSTANIIPSSPELRASGPANIEISVAKIIEAILYSWPHDSTFDSKNTALVMIDTRKIVRNHHFTPGFHQLSSLNHYCLTSCFIF